MAAYAPKGNQEAKANRQAFMQKAGLDHKRLVLMPQIHSVMICSVCEESPGQECDGMVTSNCELALGVLVADCIGLFYYDVQKRVIACAHAGRKGTFENIAGKTVQKMQDDFGCDAKDIHVYMSPSIGKCCYEVDGKLRSFVTEKFSDAFVHGANIDLQGLNKAQLLKAGIKKHNLSDAAICTQCQSSYFYSYRAQKENSGRNIGIISLG